jgi:hypothetical protein
MLLRKESETNASSQSIELIAAAFPFPVHDLAVPGRAPVTLPEAVLGPQLVHAVLPASVAPRTSTFMQRRGTFHAIPSFDENIATHHSLSLTS